ncbi:MAG: chemotaxis protein CheD [Pseudomonadota bacterium]
MKLAQPDSPEQAAVMETYLLPGGLSAAAVPVRCTTILGSCVAVCLFDPGRAGGMNHFQLPGIAPHDDPDPLRWSDTACERLLVETLAAGGRRAHLQAKVFGGASITTHAVPDRLRIGQRNAEAADAALRRMGIPVTVADVGGQAGRKLVFEFHTGKAWIRSLAHHAG